MWKYISLMTMIVLASTAANAAEYVVKMKFDEDAGKVYFEPATLKVKSGDTVTWVQEDKINEHNVVTYPNGIPKGTNMFESPMMRQMGEKWTRTFSESGTYRYHCHPHEAVGMIGMVIVDRESRADEFRASKPGEHMHGKGMEHGQSHDASPGHGASRSQDGHHGGASGGKHPH